MSTFLNLLSFELGGYLKRVAPYVFFLAFGAFALLFGLLAGGAFPGSGALFGGDRVLVDSPFVLTLITVVLTFYGALVTAALFGQAATRDFTSGAYPLLFSSGVGKGTLLGARFLAALGVNGFIFLAVPAGLFAASLFPIVDETLYGAGRLAGYLGAFPTFVIPNLLVTGALFFGVGLLARRMLPVYLTGAALVLGYLMASVLAGEIESKTMAALLDPFGTNALSVLTEYWTVAEKNNRLIPLSGVVLQNRLIWGAVGLLVLVGSLALFRFAEPSRGRRFGRRPEGARLAPPRTAVALPDAGLDFGFRAQLKSFGSLMRREFWAIVKSTGFIMLTIGMLGFMAITLTQRGQIYGTETYPVTYQILELLGGTFGIFLIIIVTFYAGEAVWRERDARVDGIVDALPVANWVPLVAKLLALVGIVAVLLSTVLFGGMLVQASQGYTRFEVGQYLTELYVFQLIEWSLFVVLAFAIHVLVDRKAVGHLVMVAYFAGQIFLPQFGLEHNLWRYGADAGRTYSDMNQYGPYVQPFAVFNLYWGAWALLLALAARLLYRRGTEGSLKTRLAHARQRLDRTSKWALAGGLVAILGLGGFVLYNTTVLNEFQTSEAVERAQARYERDYKRWDGRLQPRITAVELDVDLVPERGEADLAGHYWMVNRDTVQTIDTLFVTTNPALELDTLAFSVPTGEPVLDEELDLRLVPLARGLAPGDSLRMAFRLKVRPRGFQNQQGPPLIAENGTFINSSLIPHLGYQRNVEISNPRTRRDYDLPERPGMRDPDDPVGLRNTYIGGDADWVRMEIRVSTAPDQIALAPGTLIREWTEDGRAHFHYRAPVPTLFFASVLSARYEVFRDVWDHPDGHVIPIEIYYHPEHPYNLERMAESVKASLSYFTEAFSPYQATEVRIVEFPRYATFAQAFLGTIPYAESIGFIARVGEGDIDYPYFVTAHEIAHQWWAHQIVGADVRGATLLSETLAEYSALVVMAERYGEADIRRFLEYDRDLYLTQRVLDPDQERPLLQVEASQGYVHYRKGGIVMYALQDYIGADAVNEALSDLVQTYRFGGPPYPTGQELYTRLQAVTPDSLQGFLADSFERITFYDLATTEVDAEGLPGGRTRITLTIEARKEYLDGRTDEGTDAPLSLPIDIGVLDRAGEPIYLQKHRITTGTNTITVTVEGEPHEAGVDPFLKLLDRDASDNLQDVELDADGPEA